LGKAVAKSYEILDLASREKVMSRTQVFDYFSKFRSGIMFHHSMTKIDENVNYGK
jgi:hypothetical protein